MTTTERSRVLTAVVQLLIAAGSSNVEAVQSELAEIAGAQTPVATPLDTDCKPDYWMAAAEYIARITCKAVEATESETFCDTECPAGLTMGCPRTSAHCVGFLLLAARASVGAPDLQKPQRYTLGVDVGVGNDREVWVVTRRDSTGNLLILASGSYLPMP